MLKEFHPIRSGYSRGEVKGRWNLHIPFALLTKSHQAQTTQRPPLPSNTGNSNPHPLRAFPFFRLVRPVFRLHKIVAGTAQSRPRSGEGALRQGRDLALIEVVCVGVRRRVGTDIAENAASKLVREMTMRPHSLADVTAAREEGGEDTRIPSSATCPSAE